MEISSVNSDLIRGNVTTIILSSLWSADRYGYDILKEIETRSDGQYKLKQATLYNQLKRLEKQGLISSYDGAPDDTGGGRRRYYALTPEGRNYLTKEKSEYEYSRTILNKLISEQDFDFTAPLPFNAEELRPYSKRDDSDEKPKVVYKEKVVERKVYFDFNGNEITEEEAKRIKESAADNFINQTNGVAPIQPTTAKPEEPAAPRLSLAEIFAKLDEQKKQSETLVETEKEEKHNLFNAFAGTADEQKPAQNKQNIEDLFNRLDAEADAKIKSAESVSNNGEQAAHDEPKDMLLEAELASPRAVTGNAPTAKISERDSAFGYETEDVNYRDFFTSIASAPRADETEQEKRRPSPISTDNADLKTRLYAEGFKIRPYARGNTSEYYSFNFIQSNVINRDTWLVMMALFALEVAIMWVSMFTRVSYVYFLTIMLVGCALCLIPFIICFLNPSKRSRANFNFKMSLLNRSMFFVELSVVTALIGFFAFGANLADIDSILTCVILPAVVYLNFPISSIVYWLLYRTKKYHVA